MQELAFFLRQIAGNHVYAGGLTAGVLLYACEISKCRHARIMPELGTGSWLTVQLLGVFCLLACNLTPGRAAHCTQHEESPSSKLLKDPDFYISCTWWSWYIGRWFRLLGSITARVCTFLAFYASLERVFSARGYVWLCIGLWGHHANIYQPSLHLWLWEKSQLKTDGGPNKR